MNKFLIILKKEIKELITIQSLIPLVIIFVAFYFLGDFIKSVSEDEQIEINASETVTGNEESTVTVSKNSVIGIIDNDNSELSQAVISEMEKSGIVVVVPSSKDPKDALNELMNYELDGNEIEIKLLAVFRAGFGEEVYKTNQSPVAIDMYSTVNTFGLLSSISSASASGITEIINSVVSQKLYQTWFQNDLVGDVNINYIKYPVYAQSYTYMNGETANVPSGSIMNYISSQTQFVPIIVFVIILSATQTLAASVVNEKADKTLETLMTTPVNRMAVLFAKVLAAAVYAIIFAVVYVIAFQNYMSSLSGNEIYSKELLDAIELFGISFNALTFIIIGVQLFLSVLCGLAVALIIGMMVEDMKGLQSYIMPIMIFIMIPYFVTMFADLNTLPSIFKIILYIIPFTHTFAAATNIFTQNYTILAVGIAYQIIFVIIMLTIAMKIFNSDKLITLSEILKGRSTKKKSLFKSR